MRVGPQGAESPAILDAVGVIRDLSGHVDDFDGGVVSIDAMDGLRGIDLERLPEIPVGTRIGPALAPVPNSCYIGLNYDKHAAETNLPEPSEPILFSEASSALHAPNDDIVIARGSRKSDWEVELGVVIGRAPAITRSKTIEPSSERELQIELMGQWINGKSAPTYGPFGPSLVARDEIADPQAFDVELLLNGETAQSSNTSDRTFILRQIVSYMSRFMRLVSGYTITTGRSEGVGMSMRPQRFLKSGRRMKIEVKGLGRQYQTCV